MQYSVLFRIKKLLQTIYLTKEERLKYCSVCKLKGFNPETGIICSLTNEVAKFENSCPDYTVDTKALLYEQNREREREKEVTHTINYGRYSLLALGGVFLLFGILEMLNSTNYSPFHNLIFLTLSVTFFTLANWSHDNPIRANQVGLALFIVIILIEGIFNPIRLVDGLVGPMTYFFVICTFIAAIKVSRSQKN